MTFTQEFLWLAKQLDQVAVSHEPSLWRALREQSTASKHQVQHKRHVYVTGEPQTIYQQTDLFTAIPKNNEAQTLTDKTNAHPALQWMTITYCPPDVLHEFKAQTFTLFVENRLPLWARSLFTEHRVGNIVVTDTIPALSRMDGVKQYRIDGFNYELLLDDVMVQQEPYVQPKQQFFNEPPKHLTMQLIATKQPAQRSVILDKMAAHMLNTYWLQNNPPINLWLPVLLKEIAAFLVIRASTQSNEKILDDMKAWGKRDKAIN